MGSRSATGQIGSLSFLPALFANAFLGSDVGLSQGGFTSLGAGDFNKKGDLRKDLRKTGTSVIDSSSFGGDNFNPFSLFSNITDLGNPNINPAVGGAMQGLAQGEIGAQLANLLSLGSTIPTFQEGLQTGFKPDLQPIIDEAQRGFFQDIVPQLGQQNVALQEGVGPFSTDLSGQLLQAGGDLQSQLGSMEVGLQENAANRRSDLLGLSSIFTDQLFNADVDAARNRLNLGEELVSTGTAGGRQATLLQLLNSLMSGQPVQANSSRTSSGTTTGGSIGTSGGGSGGSSTTTGIN